MFEIIFTALFLPGFIALGWFINKLVPVPEAVLLTFSEDRLHFRFNEGVSPAEIELANSGFPPRKVEGALFC